MEQTISNIQFDVVGMATWLTMCCDTTLPALYIWYTGAGGGGTRLPGRADFCPQFVISIELSSPSTRQSDIKAQLVMLILIKLDQDQ